MKTYGQFAEHKNILESLKGPKTPSFTFDVDICFSGGGDTLRVVSFAAELSVLVHTCNWHIGEDNVALQCCMNSKQPILKVKIARNILINVPQLRHYFTSILGGKVQNSMRLRLLIRFQVWTNWTNWFLSASKAKSQANVPCQPQWRSENEARLKRIQKNTFGDDPLLYYTSKVHTAMRHVVSSNWASPLWCTVVASLFAGSLFLHQQFPSFNSHRSAQLE